MKLVLKRKTYQTDSFTGMAITELQENTEHPIYPYYNDDQVTVNFESTESSMKDPYLTFRQTRFSSINFYSPFQPNRAG